MVKAFRLSIYSCLSERHVHLKRQPRPLPHQNKLIRGSRTGALEPVISEDRIEKPRFNLPRPFVPSRIIFNSLTKRHVIALNYLKTWLHTESQCAKCDATIQDVA